MLAEVQSEERAAAALVPDDDDRTRVAPAAQPRSRTQREGAHRAGDGRVRGRAAAGRG